MRHVWIVTATRSGAWGSPDEESVVGVAGDYYAARELVTEHAESVGCYLDEWAMDERNGEVGAVGLEGDDCEVTARRWEVVS